MIKYLQHISFRWLFIFVLVTTNIYAQSPYEIDWKKESIYLGIGTSTITTALLLNANFEGLKTEDVSGMDRANVHRFDRKATFHYSSEASHLSDIFSIGSHVLPFLFIGEKETRKEFGTIVLMYGEALMITGGLTGLTKRFTKRPRPYVYNEMAPITKKQSRTARYSFFSGHTSSAATNSFFAAKVFSDYFPDSKLKPYVWFTAASIPAITGYLRYKAGKHYPTDVLTGYAVGAVIGVLIPHLHRAKETNSLSLQLAPNAIQLSWNFK